MTEKSPVDFVRIRERLNAIVEAGLQERLFIVKDQSSYNDYNNAIVALSSAVEALAAVETVLDAKAERERRSVALPQKVLDFKK